MKQEFLVRKNDSDEITVQLGLEIAPGVAITESMLGDGYVMTHIRSGCAIGPPFEHPEDAAHAFYMHLARFDWTRSGGEIAYDLEVLMAVREIHPRSQLTRHTVDFFKDVL